MTLELSQLTAQTRAMGQELAARAREHADQIAIALDWLSRYADQGPRLRHAALAVRAAVPTAEPLDACYPLPTAPERFTFIAADGALIQPDRHGNALYYLINIGSLVYRHGSGEAPQARSFPTLAYREDDLYENGLLVSGNLLDARRDMAELNCLADLCAAEPAGPTVAVVDGTLILWVLENLPAEGREKKIADYLAQLERIRRSGAAAAALISRPQRGEVTALLYLASIEGEVDKFNQEQNPLAHLSDRAVFEAKLAPGARSALFVSPSEINHKHYQPAGHEIRFFYVNVAPEGRAPAVARVETPAWVADDAGQLALVHAAIVAQARITGDYPYALARADELAFISSQEREALEEMVATSLVRAGLRPTLSPKQSYKTLTRGGRKRHTL